MFDISKRFAPSHVTPTEFQSAWKMAGDLARELTMIVPDTRRLSIALTLLEQSMTMAEREVASRDPDGPFDNGTRSGSDITG